MSNIILKQCLLILCQVFKNLQLFLENKQPGDDLFDRLNVRMSEYPNGNVWV